MSINTSQLGQFLRFGVVGLSNTAVDFAAFFLLTWGSVPYLLAQVLAYGAGVTNSFLLNRRWTFKVGGRASLQEAVRFVMVNGVSLLVAAGCIYILHGLVSMGLWPAKVAATAGGVMVNYIGTRMWVFPSQQTITGDVFQYPQNHT